MLFKKEDRTLLTNWRPITLLTTDYKILTKALANRLQKLWPCIVHSDQTASVKGRTINNNTRLLHDVIAYANEKKVRLAMISIDQLKAFDRVAHSFLFKALECFGFGPSFRRWIQVIYNSVSRSVQTNGWLTAFITLERGLFLVHATLCFNSGNYGSKHRNKLQDSWICPLWFQRRT